MFITLTSWIKFQAWQKFAKKIRVGICIVQSIPASADLGKSICITYKSRLNNDYWFCSIHLGSRNASMRAKFDGKAYLVLSVGIHLHTFRCLFWYKPFLLPKFTLSAPQSHFFCYLHFINAHCVHNHFINAHCVRYFSSISCQGCLLNFSTLPFISFFCFIS